MVFVAFGLFVGGRTGRDGWSGGGWAGEVSVRDREGGVCKIGVPGSGIRG